MASGWMPRLAQDGAVAREAVRSADSVAALHQGTDVFAAQDAHEITGLR